MGFYDLVCNQYHHRQLPNKVASECTVHVLCLIYISKTHQSKCLLVTAAQSSNSWRLKKAIR